MLPQFTDNTAYIACIMFYHCK